MLMLALVAPLGHAQNAAEAPTTVTIGAYINDIQAIDLRTHSYGVDLYVWFRWSDPDIDPTETFEFINLFDPEAHVEDVLYDEPQPQPDGSLYQLIRHQGLFTTKFPVQRYPFDAQKLLVALEDAEDGSESFQFVLDEVPLTLNPEVTLPGYDIGEAFAIVRDKPYPTAFGDLAEPDVSAYSRVEFMVPIRHPVVAGVFKSLIPVLLIILSAAFALLLDPEHVEARIGLAITALLTLVAMQFTMLAGLPEVAYLTLLDQIFLASYGYILVVIGLVVRGTRTDEKGAIQGGAGSLSRLVDSGPPSAAVATFGYLGVVAVILWWNLSG
ncbi:MAG: hypothetical protein AAF253_00760 [Pseudomonadota bacterium]